MASIQIVPRFVVADLPRDGEKWKKGIVLDHCQYQERQYKDNELRLHATKLALAVASSGLTPRTVFSFWNSKIRVFPPIVFQPRILTFVSFLTSRHTTGVFLFIFLLVIRSRMLQAHVTGSTSTSMGACEGLGTAILQAQ